MCIMQRLLAPAGAPENQRQGDEDVARAKMHGAQLVDALDVRIAFDQLTDALDRLAGGRLADDEAGLGSGNGLLGGHQFSSSSDLVRRKAMTEITATMMKMMIE